MKIDRTGRRMFLTGMGSAALSVPFLSSYAGVVSAVPQTPRIKRAVFIAVPYGTWRDVWFPADRDRAMTRISGRATTMPLSGFSGDPSEVWNRAEFADIFPHMVMLDGIDHSYRTGHTKALPYTGYKGDNASEVGGPSIDQIIAERALIYEGTPTFRSYNINNGPGYHHGTTISYREVGGQLQEVPAVNEPEAVWDDVFSNVSGGDPDEDARRQRRQMLGRSVLDDVIGDYRSLLASPRLSENDRRRLTAYVDYLREYEQSIGEAPTVACTRPVRPETFDRRSQWEERGIAHARNITHMLRCGVTNLVSFNLEPTSREYPWSEGEDSHPLSHQMEDMGRINAARDVMAQNDRAQMRMVREIVRGLDVENPETGRSFLHDTVVCVIKDMGSIVNHLGARCQTALFGGKDVLQNGVLMDFRSEVTWHHASIDGRSEGVGIATNNLWIELLQLFGLQPEDYENGQAGFGAYDPSKYYFRYFPGGNSDEGRMNYEAYAYGDKRTGIPELHL